MTGSRMNNAMTAFYTVCALGVLTGCIDHAVAPVAKPATSRSNPEISSAEAAIVPPAVPADNGDTIVAPETSHEPVVDPAPLEERSKHPLVDKTKAELEKLLRADPAQVGSASLGQPSLGALFGGVQMPKDPRWKIVAPRETWGTQETVDYITSAVDRVHQQFPNTKPLAIGDIGVKRGGHHKPHSSHQSGRDVDLGFYYTGDQGWYTMATKSNLDRPRTWALIRAFLSETDVEVIFLDHSVQKMLRSYAETIGEDAAWLDSIFGGPLSKLKPMIRFSPGHRSHMHVRFFNPIAQETGRRIYRLLLKLGKIRPPTYYIKYKARRGDSLGRIAKRFRTSVRTLKRANRLRSSRIYAGRKYRIPRRGGVAQSSVPLELPRRRVPPALRSAGNSADVATKTAAPK